MIQSHCLGMLNMGGESSHITAHGSQEVSCPTNGSTVCIGDPRHTFNRAPLRLAVQADPVLQILTSFPRVDGLSDGGLYPMRFSLTRLL